MTLARSLPVRVAICSWVILEFAAKSLICAGLFHGVQVGALQVLHDCHLKCLLIRHLADYCGDGFFVGFGGGQPAAFAGEELVVVCR